MTSREVRQAPKPGPALLGRLGRLAVLLAITAFFAVMWGLLIKQHLRTASATEMRPNYDNLLGPDEQERSSAWGIYFSGLRIGRLDMRVRRETDGTIEVRTTAAVSINAAARYIVGVSGDLDAKFLATISPLRGLMFFQVDSKLLDASLRGSVHENEIMLVGHVGEERIRTTLPYDPDTLFGEALSPLTALPELRESQVGRSWTIDMVNPITGDVQKVTIAVAGSKRIVLGGKKVRAFDLTFTAGSSRWASWVTESGEVLIQGTPFGLTMQREDLPADVLGDLAAPPAQGVPAQRPPAQRPPKP